MTGLPDLVRHANNWNVAKNLTDKFPHPYTEADGRDFIAFANSDEPVHIFAIAIENKAVGWHWAAPANGHSPQKCGTGLLAGRAVLGKWDHQ